MACKKEKRNYSYPFSTEETMIFLDIVKKYKGVIENKITDGATTAEKNTAWQQIAQEFNSRGIAHVRTADTLRTKWKTVKRGARNKNSENLRERWNTLKKDARSAEVAHNNYLHGTGGGPQGKPIDLLYDKVLEVVDRKSIEGSKGCPDSEYGKLSATRSSCINKEKSS